jgi:hypothetical protein
MVAMYLPKPVGRQRTTSLIDSAIGHDRSTVGHSNRSIRQNDLDVACRESDSMPTSLNREAQYFLLTAIAEQEKRHRPSNRMRACCFS